MSKHNTNKVIESSIWYAASNFLLTGLSFLTTPIFARLLTKEQYGGYSNYTSWLSVLTIIATLSLTSSLVAARFDYKEDLDSYSLSILSLGSITTIVLYSIVRLNIEYFEVFLSMDKFYINFLFIYIFVSQPINIFQNIQRFQYKYKTSVFVSIVTSISSVMLSLLLVISLEDKMFGRIVGNYLPLIVVNLFFYAIYLIKGCRIKLEYWKYALKICIPFIPHLLSLTVLSASDKLMITNMIGPRDTALYSLAYSIALVVTILASSINTAFSPWLGEKIYENNTRSVYNISTMYVLIIAVPMIGVMLIAPEVLYIMGGKSYMEAMYVIPPVMVGCLLQHVYTMYVNVEQYKKKTVGMAIASVSTTILNIVLNYIFIPKFGYIAAAYTTLVSYGFLVFFHYQLVKKLEMTNLYNTKNIVLIIVGELTIGLLMNLFYLNNVIRYIFVGVYGIILIYLLIKYKDKLKLI